MIDPKTLRIGSHVMVDGVRARVTDIESNYDWSGDTLLRFCAVIDGEKRTCGAFSQKDGVEPIPITAELLEELGFEKRESGFFAKEYAPDSWVFLTIYATKELCKVNIYPSVPRKEASSVFCHLHELEAFLYLTTKTELIKE